ncbi:MAG: RNA-binding S4 domain-containing protein [Microbacterium sp.]|uniref:RNA-binding S4 domain-containing protein n=1 Tax=Microbacterium sp. TaxID=51671 RepID=UPI00271A8A10|nr:RNA-binding S4 domain-containing protein [Microbacterium sp.]MDO8383358.1 RNA-binding S4 domain-containing protein [Microbacterium sp.]
MTNSAPIDDIPIGGDMIRLGPFMKFAGLLDSGGEVKEAIIDGLVTVNGDVERRRGRQLHVGDIVEFGPRTVRVCP